MMRPPGGTSPRMIMSRSVFATCLANGILRDSVVRGRGAHVAAGFGSATCSMIPPLHRIKRSLQSSVTANASQRIAFASAWLSIGAKVWLFSIR
jgi:hypothetical protein